MDRVVNSIAAAWSKPTEFAFVSPLTPFECYQRLKKVPERRTYMTAKVKLGIVNSSHGLRAEWDDVNQVCHFSVPVQIDRSHFSTASRTREVLSGNGSWSTADSTTLVKGVIHPMRHYFIDGLPTSYGILAIVAFMVSYACGFSFIRGTSWPSGWAFSIAILGVIAVLALLPFLDQRQLRIRLQLITMVLTEPDEMRL
jgi:hypothetical protein